MKKFILTAAAIFMIGILPALARQTSTDEKKTPAAEEISAEQPRVREPMRGSSLDEKQRREVSKLMDRHASRHEARIRAEQRLREKNRKAAQKDLVRLERRMKKILSEDQYYHWKEDQRRGHGRDGYTPSRPGGPGRPRGGR